MTKHSESDNFEEWIRAYLVAHPRPKTIGWDGCETLEDADSEFTYSDMFAAWVGGAIFTCNRMFNPTRPHVPPLPDIFQAITENPSDEPG